MNTDSIFIRVWHREKVCILSVNRFLLSYFAYLPGRKILGERTAAKFNMTVLGLNTVGYSVAVFLLLLC